MKTYIVINPITNKPVQFSSVIRDDIKFGETYTDESGDTSIRFNEPIYLEVSKPDDKLLTKIYNPKTKKLEDM